MRTRMKKERKEKWAPVKDLLELPQPTVPNSVLFKRSPEWWEEKQVVVW